jgi:hypothetical protein
MVALKLMSARLLCRCELALAPEPFPIPVEQVRKSKDKISITDPRTVALENVSLTGPWRD